MRRALELNKDSLSSYIIPMATYLLEGKEAAIQAMQRIIKAEPKQSMHYYNAACLYARMGQADKALQYLKKTMEMGYTDYPYMMIDRDLRSIHDTQAFNDLIAPYRSARMRRMFENLQIGS